MSMANESRTHVDSLRQEIASALNRHCCENESNTPDFLLAEFLLGCLRAWDDATRKRERWYGRNPNQGPGHVAFDPTHARNERDAD